MTGRDNDTGTGEGNSIVYGKNNFHNAPNGVTG